MLITLRISMRTRCARRLARLSVALLIGVGVAACGAGASESRAPLEIERLAFISPGGFLPWKNTPCRTDEPLLVDRFEVTRELWWQWLDAEGSTRFQAPPGLRPERDEAGLRLPMTGMNLEEAREFAAWRGMRLPTGTEWMRFACGTFGLPWPWGNRNQSSIANTIELDLGRPAPVGTFENGVTGTGIYDLLGNVWEWTDPPMPPLPGVSRNAAMGALSPDRDAMLGGSFLSHSSPLYTNDYRETPRWLGKGTGQGYRANDVGLRCAVGAEEYLLAHAQAWSHSELRECLLKVGASPSWSRRSVPLLERLAGAPDAAPALGWLLEGAKR